MPAPIILISNQRIKPGRLEAYKERYSDAVQRFLARRPGTLAHAAYTNEDATEVSVVMAFADAQAMEVHILGLGSSPQGAQENMGFVSVDIYGAPSAAALEGIHSMVGPGVPVTVRPHAVNGFIRSGAAAQ